MLYFQGLNIKLGIQIGNIESHRFSKFEQESMKRLGFETRKTQFMAIFKFIVQTLSEGK